MRSLTPLLALTTGLLLSSCEVLDDLEESVGPEETIQVVYEREFEVRSFEPAVDEELTPTRLTPCDDIFVCDNFNRVKSMEVVSAERQIIYVQSPAGFGGVPIMGGFEVMTGGRLLDDDFYTDVRGELGATVPLNNAATASMGSRLLNNQNVEITGRGWTDPAHHRIGLRYRFVVEVRLEIL